MSTETICKTVHQYNKMPIPPEDMQKLQEIAADYKAVKNYVYQRYGGIRSLPKLYPGYTVQNEMTASGLRAQLGLPSVYFYLAVFDALGDIKNQWTQVKNKISGHIKNHPDFTPEEKHYLRFVLKISSCFEDILLDKEISPDSEWGEKYYLLSRESDAHKLNQYLRRQVRRNLKKCHTDTADVFSIAERAYRYGNHGIYISTKQSRKRIFIPLTDSNQYKKQLHILLHPEEGKIEIRIPIEMTVKKHEDYDREIGLAIGMRNLFVTDEGKVYGDKYLRYQTELTEYIRQGIRRYQKNKQCNSGRKKYYAGKERMEARLHTYINAEINRLIETEKPGIIYTAKLPQSPEAGINKKINQSVSLWQRGYIRKRLSQKCMEHSIELTEVFGKDISVECSFCGSIGKKRDEMFLCPVCGIQMYDRENTARNILNRGRNRETENRS